MPLHDRNNIFYRDSKKYAPGLSNRSDQQSTRESMGKSAKCRSDAEFSISSSSSLPGEAVSELEELGLVCFVSLVSEGMTALSESVLLMCYTWNTRCYLGDDEDSV